MDYFKILLLIFSLVSCAFGEVEWRPKIIGGHEAVPHIAPFMVSIATVRPQPEIPQQFCGASIMSKDWVLSAAHCMHISLLRDYLAIAGQHNRTLDNPDHRQIRTIDFFINHEKWNPMGPDLAYDISLLRVNEEFTLNEFVSPISLPRDDEITYGDAIVYGWGRINFENPWVMSDVLKTLTVPVLRFEDCLLIMSRFGLSLDPTNLCTSNKIEDSGTCNSDSGGPLIKGEGSSKRQIGIVSWSPGGRCGAANSADVFVRVSAFTDWIRKHMNES